MARLFAIGDGAGCVATLRALRQWADEAPGDAALGVAEQQILRG
jgi:hypothetical protein